MWQTRPPHSGLPSKLSTQVPMGSSIVGEHPELTPALHLQSASDTVMQLLPVQPHWLCGVAGSRGCPVLCTTGVVPWLGECAPNW